MEPLDSYVRHLMDYGLTSYEARAYLALLRRETFTAAELAAEAQVPRQRIYDTVSSLISRGMARDESGPVTRYSAHDPEEVFARLQADKQRELDQMSAHAGRIVQEVAKVWTAGQRETSPLDYVQVLHDPHRIEAAAIELWSTAQHSVAQLSKPPYVLPGNAVALEGAKRLCAAGGVSRCIYEDSALSNEVVLDELREFVAVGELARSVPTLPLKLMIVDGRRAFLALPDPLAGQQSSTVMLIDHAAYAAMLELTFEHLWVQAQPLDLPQTEATGSDS